MKHEPYSSRRQILLDTIGDGVAIVPTAPECIRNRDSHHPYRFDSYFWYLTGFPEPEAVAVLVGGKEPRSILFFSAARKTRSAKSGTVSATARPQHAMRSVSMRLTPSTNLSKNCPS